MTTLAATFFFKVMIKLKQNTESIKVLKAEPDKLDLLQQLPYIRINIHIKG